MNQWKRFVKNRVNPISIVDPRLVNEYKPQEPTFRLAPRNEFSPYRISCTALSKTMKETWQMILEELSPVYINNWNWMATNWMVEYRLLFFGKFHSFLFQSPEVRPLWKVLGLCDWSGRISQELCGQWSILDLVSVILC